MKYSTLKSILEELEHKHGGNATRGVSSAYCAVQPTGGNVQFFALDASSAANGENLPVVVSLGPNYSQGPHRLPAPLTGRTVEDGSLAACRRNLQGLLSCIRKTSKMRPLPKMTPLPGRFSLPNPSLPGDDFHFVMTNFCPWITCKSWLTHLKCNRALMASLLRHWPNPGASPNPGCLMKPLTPRPGAPPAWELPLTDLLSSLPDDTLWVGHGWNSIPDEFAFFLGRLKINNWIFTSNLAFPTSRT